MQGTSPETVPTPPFKLLPAREFSSEFSLVRRALFELIEPYYDRAHLTRAADWMLAAEPEAAEHLVLAALTHDLERSVAGGPKLDMANEPWDDAEYNRRHCGRSAELVPRILTERGASASMAEAVQQPIREHEFGGSPEGDLMQAADSLSFLEINGRLCASWVQRGMCSREKGIVKLDWMFERIRLQRARATAAALHTLAVADFERELGIPAEVEAA